MSVQKIVAFAVWSILLLVNRLDKCLTLNERQIKKIKSKLFLNQIHTYMVA